MRLIFTLEATLISRIVAFWGLKTPKIINEKPLYPQPVTVGCGFWAVRIIGPYFFENKAGATVSIN